MPRFILHQDRCKQCGICSQACPAKIIKGGEGETPTPRAGFEGRCISCGHCTAFCPHRACDIDVLPAEQYRLVDRKLLPSVEAVDMLCKARRSTRFYKTDPVPRETAAAVLDTVRYAPSAKNQQALRFICLGRESLNKLCDLMSDRLEQPETTALIAEAKGLAAAWRRGMDLIFRGAPHAIFVVGPKGDHWSGVDAAIAATYLEVAALPHGIGCCWAGYASILVQGDRDMEALLGLRDGEAVHAVQMFGFIRLKPTGIPARKVLDCRWID